MRRFSKSGRCARLHATRVAMLIFGQSGDFAAEAQAIELDWVSAISKEFHKYRLLYSLSLLLLKSIVEKRKIKK